MVTLTGAGKSSGLSLTGTSWRPKTVPECLVARAVMACRPAEAWPTGILFTCQSPPEEKRKRSQVLTAATHTSLIDVSKFSSYWKLVHTTAWILCFLNNVHRKGKSVGELAATELTAARMYWVRVVQEQAFTTDLQSLRKNLPLPKGLK